MKTSELLFIGAKAHVAAVNRRDGTLIWKAKLTGGLKISGSGFVTLLVEEERVYAYTFGSLYCLDAATGQKLFHCQITGLGGGLAMLATMGQSSLPVAPAAHALVASANESAVVAATAVVGAS
jgi:outer membrane protein assembly factor BamB